MLLITNVQFGDLGGGLGDACEGVGERSVGRERRMSSIDRGLTAATHLRRSLASPSRARSHCCSLPRSEN